MDSFQDSLAFWVTVAGTVVGFWSLIQSRAWLAAFGAFAALISVAAILYAWKIRRRARLATVSIAGRSIDSLNLASLGRRLNRSLVIQGANQVATIRGEDLSIVWRYEGFCRAAVETAIEFSIDADSNVPFEDLDCVAYDLRRDPDRLHKIRPILVGTDGISKKISVPFLEPINAQEQFAVELVCALPGCMKAGVEYYTATLSIEQELIPRYSVRLIFEGGVPEWVRLYERRQSGQTLLLKDLSPVHVNPQRAEYRDACDNVSARSARIYIFRRSRQARF